MSIVSPLNDFQHLELRRLGEVVAMTPTWFMKEKCESYGAASPSNQASLAEAIYTSSTSPRAGIAFANEELARQIRAFESCTPRRVKNAKRDV